MHGAWSSRLLFILDTFTFLKGGGGGYENGHRIFGTTNQG